MLPLSLTPPYACALQLPTLGFLYVAGQVGYVGRKYLNEVKSTQKEIIIDVPLALSLVSKGWAWPVEVAAVSTCGSELRWDAGMRVHVPCE